MRLSQEIGSSSHRAWVLIRTERHLPARRPKRNGRLTGWRPSCQRRRRDARSRRICEYSHATDSLDSSEMNRLYAKHFKLGDAPANSTVGLAHLPYGANVAFSGVAVMNVATRRPVRPRNMSPSAQATPCMFAGDTLYCSAKSAYLPGPNQGIYAESIENQVRQTMRNLIDGLQEAGIGSLQCCRHQCVLGRRRGLCQDERRLSYLLQGPVPDPDDGATAPAR